MLLRLSFVCLIALAMAVPALAQVPTARPTLGPELPSANRAVAPALEPTPTPLPPEVAPPTEAPTELPTEAPTVPSGLPRGEAWALALGAFLAIGAGLAVIGLVASLSRRRPRKGTTTRNPWREEVSARAAGVSSALPALRDALASTLRALDRAYVLATAPSRRAHEAWTFAQDLSEQAAGLHERLLQAQLQSPATEAPGPRALGDRLTQLALDLALAATPEARAEQALTVAAELRALGVELGQKEPAQAGQAPWIPYLVELSASLQARCARLEGILATSESEETLATRLRDGRDALDRAIAQAEFLADRVRTLEEALSQQPGRSA